MSQWTKLGQAFRQRPPLLVPTCSVIPHSTRRVSQPCVRRLKNCSQSPDNVKKLRK
jgi:hypothetical protein